MTARDLLVAARTHREANPPKPFVQAHGVAGELVVAESPEGTRRRVVLVTAADSAGVAHVLLASNMIDQATDLDLIVTSPDSGASYDLVVQAELYGPVFIEQLDAVVGSCDAAAVDALRAALRSDGASLEGLRIGLPLGGPIDPRRRFKEQELAELQEIVSACRRWLLGDAAEVVCIDPEELFPPPSGTSPEDGFDRLDRLVTLLDSYEKAGRYLPFELLAMLDESAHRELRRWHSEYGYDIWRTLQRLARHGDSSVEEVEVERENLTESFLARHAEAGTRTVDLVASTTLDGDLIVAKSRTRTRPSYCRARRTTIGAML